MSILNRKKEDFAGYSRRSLRGKLSNERLGERWRIGRRPIIQPGGNACSEISRAFGEEPLGQFGGAALQVALTDFDHRQQFVTFALPLRFSMFAAKALPEKAQVVRATE